MVWEQEIKDIKELQQCFDLKVRTYMMDMLKECSMHDKKYIKTLTSTNANLKKEE